MKKRKKYYQEIKETEMEIIHAGVIINGSKLLQWIVKLIAPGNII